MSQPAPRRAAQRITELEQELAAARAQAPFAGRLEAELKAVRADLENAKTAHAMYANAWQRELAAAGALVNKRHHIDAMVVSTRHLAASRETAWAAAREHKERAELLATVAAPFIRDHARDPEHLAAANALLLALAVVNGTEPETLEAPARWPGESWLAAQFRRAVYFAMCRHIARRVAAAV